MKKIGITGSLASGKTTACKILANKGPIFSADLTVKKLYKKKDFKTLIAKKLKIKNPHNLKKIIKIKILIDKSVIKKLENIIHPFVRQEMKKFIKKHKQKKILFFEIPLLIESKLMDHFNAIIFIKSKKSLRIKRFKAKGGSEKLFKVLNSKQLSDDKKLRYCDHIVVNEKNKIILKKRLLNIIKFYE
tara:strand:- start:843 stop:1406 length:564 start_codon:yes stop_codon:yes gene_type:complete